MYCATVLFDCIVSGYHSAHFFKFGSPITPWKDEWGVLHGKGGWARIPPKIKPHCWSTWSTRWCGQDLLRQYPNGEFVGKLFGSGWDNGNYEGLGNFVHRPRV